MKSILTILLCCIFTVSIAQTTKDTKPADDIYGNPRKKSLVEVDQPKINLNLPGNYLKKSANCLTGGILLGILTGVAGAYLSKDKPDVGKYVYIGGGVISTGLLFGAAVNLGKAGDELNRVMQEQQRP